MSIVYIEITLLFLLINLSFQINYSPSFVLSNARTFHANITRMCNFTEFMNDRKFSSSTILDSCMNPCGWHCSKATIAIVDTVIWGILAKFKHYNVSSIVDLMFSVHSSRDTRLFYSIMPWELPLILQTI